MTPPTDREAAAARAGYLAAGPSGRQPMTWDKAHPEVQELWLQIVRTIGISNDAHDLAAGTLRVTREQFERAAWKIARTAIGVMHPNNNLTTEENTDRMRSIIEDQWSSLEGAAHDDPK